MVLVVVDIACSPGGAVTYTHQRAQEGFLRGFEGVVYAGGDREHRFFELFKVPHNPAHRLGADALAPGGEVDGVESAGDDVFESFVERQPASFVASLDERVPGGGGGRFPERFRARDADADVREGYGATPVGERAEAGVVFEDAPGEALEAFRLSPLAPARFLRVVGLKGGLSVGRVGARGR